MRVKYPLIEPHTIGFLERPEGHSLYWEESGNPNGLPVIFLHGGPGAGTDPSHRSFFNPQVYRIILMDQRGCGKSTPHARLDHNTTWHLVDDIEWLRMHLDVPQWVVFGGSWGSTLALAYAETYPEQVLALILRGIFLGTSAEIKWSHESGANQLFPDVWEKFIALIPKEERGNLVHAYYKRLNSEDPIVRKKAALAWSSWEGALLKLHFDETTFLHFTESAHAEAIARIECHYFVNHCFFKTDNWLLENIQKVRHIPTRIIHGRYDVICPLQSAWALHKAFPESELQIIPDAGHAASEPGITDALISATDEFGAILS